MTSACYHGNELQEIIAFVRVLFYFVRGRVLNYQIVRGINKSYYRFY